MLPSVRCAETHGAGVGQCAAARSPPMHPYYPLRPAFGETVDCLTPFLRWDDG